ncbi:MAG: hypothetical protein M1812_004701 [Candelaria pacifica]|nr:MAG: hypothetical protein M1812_004701 [Candelaria pacifica]
MSQKYNIFVDLDSVAEEDFLVVRADGCDCGHYRFYSDACNHVYAVVIVECAKVTWVTKDPTYCDKPARYYDVESWKAIDPCEECAKRAGAGEIVASRPRQ